MVEVQVCGDVIVRKFGVSVESIQGGLNSISGVGKSGVKALEGLGDVILKILLIELGIPSSLTERKKILS